MQEQVRLRKRSGDLNRCALIFGHDYAYLVQVSNGARNNQDMLEDLLYVIQERERMEAQMREKATQRKGAVA